MYIYVQCIYIFYLVYGSLEFIEKKKKKGIYIIYMYI